MRPLRRLCLVALILSTSVPAAAERLALRRYTTADGLPSDTVRVLLRDSLGALWVGTDEGLARFDGRTFRTMGIAEGLPHPGVKALRETKAGELWVGTESGLAVLSLLGDGGTCFEAVPLRGDPSEEQPSVLALDEDAHGVVWVGTAEGAFRVGGPAGRRHVEPKTIEFVNAGDDSVNWRYVRAVLAAPDGAIWFGTSTGVYRCEEGRTCQHTPDLTQLPSPIIHALARSPDGQIWAAGRAPGIARIEVSASRSELVARLYQDDLPRSWVMQLQLEGDHNLMAATLDGLLRLDISDRDRPRVVQRFGRASGFPNREFSAIALAEDGVCFVGHSYSGLVRWDLRGITSYIDDPGLPRGHISALFRARNGAWVGVDSVFGQLVQQVADRFVTIEPRLPAGVSIPWWPTGLHASDHRWWIPTTEGVCIFPPSGAIDALAGVRPERCLGQADGLPRSAVFGLFEDAHGDVWISSERDGLGALSRWLRREQRLERFGPEQGLPDIHFARLFAEDREGAIWVGTYAAGLLRYKDGRFERVDVQEKLRRHSVHSLLLDRAGRLWVSFYSGGLHRCDDPSAAAPTFHRIGREQGLTSEQAGALTEDRSGRVYYGTTQGLFRFDTTSRRTRRFGLEDGLPTLFTRDVISDGEGAVWIALDEGIARVVPTADATSPPPDPVIVDLRAGGIPLALPLLGRATMERVDLPASRSSVELTVSAPSLGDAAGVLFQTRLDPVAEEFGAPTADPTCFYPSLAPGRYTITVRSLGPAGAVSTGFAKVEVRIRPPLWQRAWFIALAAGILALLGYLAHRQNLEKRLAVERMRLRIATDLHDDLGSSLSSIALQSEVLGRTSQGLVPAERERLHRIGEAAAAMVETMSDIVWAVNPRYDRLSQLAHRIHRFARETLEPAGIAVQFAGEGGLDEVELDSAARRQLYLMSKELIHNALKHSGAEHVAITIARTDGRTVLEVRDDGRGYDPAAVARPGLGLESLRRRAATIGATLEIASAPGMGARFRIGL